MEKSNIHYSNKLQKTFARRIGRKLSDASQRILDEKIPNHLYDQEKFCNSSYDEKFLEIGFGMGEHFAAQVNGNPDKLYLGAEVYINGVAKALKKLEGDNFMIWPDDVNLIIEKMPSESLDGIYVLFPDPWHKKKYLPRRLFNSERLAIMKRVIKKGGFISFASDIEDYFTIAEELLTSDSELLVEQKNYQIPHAGYVQTKYHSKAIAEGRIAQFITAIKKI